LIGTGWRDGIVRTLEDIVLGPVAEIVEIGVKGRRVGTLVHLTTTFRTELLSVGRVGKTHVVLLLLEPVEGALGTVSAVTGRSFRDTVGGVSTAPTRELRCGQRNVGGGSGDVALESSHIVYTPMNKRWVSQKIS
jgi:hypothetical protein